MKKNCRTCLTFHKDKDSVSVNVNIFGNKSVLNLIEDWASIEVAKADKADMLPPVICKTCFQTMQTFIDFILLIRKSDIELKRRLFENDDKTYNTRPKDGVRGKLEEIDTVREKLRHRIINKCDVFGCNQDQDKLLNKSKNKNKLFEEPSNTFINSEISVNCIEEFGPPLTEMRKQPPMLYKCLNCPKTFKRLYQYKMHITVHTGEKQFLCPFCGKYFSRRYVLIYHMRVHTGEKKFHCNICSKSFIHPSNLYKHRKIHTNTRNYRCEYCNISFIQSEALKIHIRRIHTGEKPFLCEICSKSFSSQSALWVHKQDKHKEKESCEICQKQFSSRILKRHVEMHKNKEGNMKKCICEQCGKNFSSDHNLKQHLLSHNGIKPYASQPMPCPLCKKFYSKRRIKSHICITVIK